MITYARMICLNTEVICIILLEVYAYLYYSPCNTLNSFALRITYALLSDKVFSKWTSISNNSFRKHSFSFSNLTTLSSTESVSKDRHINEFIHMNSYRNHILTYQAVDLVL